MITAAEIQEIDEWLDSNTAEHYQKNKLALNWTRIIKIEEELGEAVAQYILVTGQNPRKGFGGSLDKVLDELADVILTAACAIQHFTKDAARTEAVIDRCVGKVRLRIHD